MNMQNEASSGLLAVSGVPHQGHLRGKVAVITEAASGIGKEIALASVRDEAKVVIADLVPNTADAGPARSIRLGYVHWGRDGCGDKDQVESGMARVIDFFGRVDARFRLAS